MGAVRDTVASPDTVVAKRLSAPPPSRFFVWNQTPVLSRTKLPFASRTVAVNARWVAPSPTSGEAFVLKVTEAGAPAMTVHTSDVRVRPSAFTSTRYSSPGDVDEAEASTSLTHTKSSTTTEDCSTAAPFLRTVRSTEVPGGR